MPGDFDCDLYNSAIDDFLGQLEKEMGKVIRQRGTNHTGALGSSAKDTPKERK